MIIGIDPGADKSGVVLFDQQEKIVRYANGEMDNHQLVNGYLKETLLSTVEGDGELCEFIVAIEWIKNYGMPVGESIFQTVKWIGRMEQQVYDCGACELLFIPRKTVCTQVCNSPKAKDPHIRQALIDWFGGKEKAIGLKKKPGPLYRVKTHSWSALAVAAAAQAILVEQDAG